MAYRQFRNEPYYEAPEVDLFPKSMALIQTYAQQKLAQQRQDKALAANWQADQQSSKFNVDAEKFGILAQDLTRKGVQDFKNYGQLSTDTKIDAERHKMYANQSAAQYERYNKVREAINKIQWNGPDGKNYFNPKIALAKWDTANYGTPEEEVDWRNRADRQEKVLPTLEEDVINNFNHGEYLQNYVKDYGKETVTNIDKNAAGVKIAKSTTAIFRDDNGVPNVTGKHAKEFLDSSEWVNKYYNKVVDTQIIDDVNKIMAHPKNYDEKLVSALGSMTPDEQITFLREHPEENPINKLSPADRQLKLAQEDLAERQRVSLKNEHDYSDIDETYRDKAKGITSDKYTVDEGSFDPTDLGGLGQGFRNLKSQTGNLGPVVNITMPYDKTNNKILGNDRGTIPTHVQGWVLGLSRGGVQVQIPGNTPDEKIKYLESQPAYFWKDIEVGPILQGKSINKKDIDDARVELTQLNMAPPESMSEEQLARKAKLENTLAALDQGDIGPEVVAGALGIKVNEVAKPVKIKKAGQRQEPEVVQLKKVFGDYDITDQKNWGNDVTSFYNRILKIREKGFLAPLPTPEIKTKKKAKEVTETVIPMVPQGKILVKVNGRRAFIDAADKDQAIADGAEIIKQ